MLILCEAKRTEPSYFNGLKKNRELGSVVVRRTKQLGSLGLEKVLERELAENPDWDEIYFVLDQDDRPTESENLSEDLDALVQERGWSDVDCKVVLSTPCFEYWLLLHFEFTDRPFTTCDQVIERLREPLPGYRKNDRHIFERCKDGVENAIRNAERGSDKKSNEPHSRPHTDVGKLVRRLLNLPKQRKSESSPSRRTRRRS